MELQGCRWVGLLNRVAPSKISDPAKSTNEISRANKLAHTTYWCVRTAHQITSLLGALAGSQAVRTTGLWKMIINNAIKCIVGNLSCIVGRQIMELNHGKASRQFQHIWTWHLQDIERNNNIERRKIRPIPFASKYKTASGISLAFCFPVRPFIFLPVNDTFHIFVPSSPWQTNTTNAAIAASMHEDPAYSGNSLRAPRV